MTNAAGSFLESQAIPKADLRGQRQDFYEWAEGRHEKWLERIEEAAKDDWRAAAFLVEHKIGKPQQSVELDDKREPPAIDAIRELQTHLRRIK